MIKNKLLNYSSDFNGKIFANGIFKQLTVANRLKQDGYTKEPEIVGTMPDWPSTVIPCLPVQTLLSDSEEDC